MSYDVSDKKMILNELSGQFHPAKERAMER
jgi:hypothetical protein